jgi:CRISPR/Cas system-associated protein Cas5 (RAMP superfamily)
MSGVDGHVAKAQWAMANRRRSRYGYPVSPMTTFLGLLCLGIVFGFLVPPVFACRRQIVQPSDEAMRVDFANAQLKLINQRIEA